MYIYLLLNRKKKNATTTKSNTLLLLNVKTDSAFAPTHIRTQFK